MRGAILSALTLFSLPAISAQIDFRKQIEPILKSKCLECHGPSQAFGGLRLHTRQLLLKGSVNGPVVVPGQPNKSLLYIAIEQPPGRPRAMPPGGPQLPPEQRNLIRDWILAGASWPEGVTLGAARPTKPIGEQAVVESIYEQIRSKQTSEIPNAKMQGYRTTIPGTVVSFDMVPIPGGEFIMGTPAAEAGRAQDEGPPHKVRIEPFWMGKYEVTWDEYRLFMFAKQAGESPGKDPLVDALSRPTRPYVEMSFGMGIEGYPAISMTQHAANKFAQWLSAKTGEFYRLPTEAEWEYACRAGTTTAYSFGDDVSKLGEYAWSSENSNGKYQKAGTKKPNPWGLYDMHGNVTEWTLDQYIPDFYAKSIGANPWAKATKSYPQTVRGGSWNDAPEQLRSGARMGSDPSWKMQDPQFPKSIWYFTDAQWLGFRLVRPLKTPGAAEMFQYWNNGVEKE